MPIPHRVDIYVEAEHDGEAQITPEALTEFLYECLPPLRDDFEIITMKTAVGPDGFSMELMTWDKYHHANPNNRDDDDDGDDDDDDDDVPELDDDDMDKMVKETGDILHRANGRFTI